MVSMFSMVFLQAENSVRLLPEAVNYLGHQLPQHFIRNIAMCSAKLNGKEGVIVEVILGRPLLSKFLTVLSSVFKKTNNLSSSFH